MDNGGVGNAILNPGGIPGRIIIIVRIVGSGGVVVGVGVDIIVAWLDGSCKCRCCCGGGGGGSHGAPWSP